MHHLYRPSLELAAQGVEDPLHTWSAGEASVPEIIDAALSAGLDTTTMKVRATGEVVGQQQPIAGCYFLGTGTSNYVVFHPDTMTVYRQEWPLHTTTRERMLLHFLMLHAGVVCSTPDLQRVIYSNASIPISIRKLRNTIDDRHRAEGLIRNQDGGYVGILTRDMQEYFASHPPRIQS